jgi:cytochrome c551/c552
MPGSQLFMMKGCIGCHSLNATVPMGIGRTSPASVAGSTSRQAGWKTPTQPGEVDPAPQTVKHGVLMPDLGVTDAEAQSLVAYLRQH